MCTVCQSGKPGFECVYSNNVLRWVHAINYFDRTISTSVRVDHESRDTTQEHCSRRKRDSIEQISIRCRTRGAKPLLGTLESGDTTIRTVIIPRSYGKTLVITGLRWYPSELSFRLLVSRSLSRQTSLRERVSVVRMIITGAESAVGRVRKLTVAKIYFRRTRREPRECRVRHVSNRARTTSFIRTEVDGRFAYKVVLQYVWVRLQRKMKFGRDFLRFLRIHCRQSTVDALFPTRGPRPDHDGIVVRAHGVATDRTTALPVVGHPNRNRTRRNTLWSHRQRAHGLKLTATDGHRTKRRGEKVGAQT